MIKKILYLFLSLPLAANALVDCGPTSCNPGGCGGSCSYSLCETVNSHTFTVEVLPFSNDPDESSACSHSTVSSAVLPFSVDGVSYITLPAIVNHRFLTCKSYSISSPPCPPPPPPPLP